ATARHRFSQAIEDVREQNVRDALSRKPEEVSNNQRLALLSDPVTISRLHYHVWQKPEAYAAWVESYQKLPILHIKG
ncbi:hypothetical protein WCU98_21150, partial [Pectobacterium parmentieri]